MDGTTGGLRLRDAAGRGLDLAVAGYQFPDRIPEPDTHDWTANWLVVRGEVDDGERRWTFSDPCLMTDEAADLARWLHDAAEGRAGARLAFVEPTLAFRLGRQAGGTVQLHVTVGAESTSEGDPRARATGVSIVVPSSQLRAAATAWAHHLADFPER